MGSKNANLASTFWHLEILLFGITFPVACILCILILVKRIRRRPLARYAPPKRQMDPSFSLGKHGGNESCGTPGGHAQDSAHNLTDGASGEASPLPSARDILQPLSHLTSLPSSGYLAAVLGREWRARAIPTPAAQAYLAEGQSPVDLCGASMVVERGQITKSNATERRSGSSDRGSSDQSRPDLKDPQWTAFTPTGWRGEKMDEDAFGVSGAGQTQPVVQQRSQTVQYLHGVDEEGSRSWKRVIVEYS